jgi:hypothetical protein
MIICISKIEKLCIDTRLCSVAGRIQRKLHLCASAHENTFKGCAVVTIRSFAHKSFRLRLLTPGAFTQMLLQSAVINCALMMLITDIYTRFSRDHKAIIIIKIFRVRRFLQFSQKFKKKTPTLCSYFNG